MSNLECAYLIIGDSAAGLAAAEAIRGCDGAADILILSREPGVAYGRPLISYMIEGKADPAKLDLKPRGYYEENDFRLLAGGAYEVVAMDAAAHEVRLAGGDVIRYGKCLVATGSDPSVPQTPGLAGQGNVFTFTTRASAQAAWDEAVRIAADPARHDGPVRVLVSGAGLIGLKAAEAFSHIGCQVTIVGRAPFLLRSVLDPQAGTILRDVLEDHGITCLTGITVGEYLGESDRITGAVLADGTTLECDLVIMAAGVRPACAFAVDAGAAQGRGLLVDELGATNLSDVWAAGDVADVTNRLDGSRGPLAQWPNAVMQGRAAGLAMVGLPVPTDLSRGDLPVNATSFFGTFIQTCGVTNPAPDAGYDVDVRVQGATYRKFIVKDGRLKGFVLMGDAANAGIYTALVRNATPIGDLGIGGDHPLLANIDFPASARKERLRKGCPIADPMVAGKE